MARSAKRKTNAARTQGKGRFRPGVWFSRHLQVALASLGRLSRSPFSSLMTSAVIGIALALPAGLHLLLGNLQALSGTWEGAASISLFLEQEVELDEAQLLAASLEQKAGIAEVRLIGRDEALAEFRQLSGFTEALDALEQNPLPHVIFLIPEEAYNSPEQAERLVAETEQLAGVDFAQLDLQWVRRFHGITEIARRGILVLGTLLGLAVLLIVGNTIRLEIQNRHAEIEITKLIGGTDAFIRRPFLYSGLWYGLFGGAIAWLLVILSLWLLAGPISRLAGLYNSQFALGGMDILSILGLLGASALLGLLGSWIAVARHLSEIEPA